MTASVESRTRLEAWLIPRGARIGIALFVVLGLSFGAAYGLRRGPLPARRVPLQSLFLDRSILPSARTVVILSAGSNPPISIRWRLLHAPMTLDRSDCGPRNDEVLREWTNGGGILGDPLIIQTVCAFGSPREAMAAFRAPIYETPGLDGPNRDIPTPADDIYPPKYALGRLTADQFDVACGLGSASRQCGEWVWRGRYAQYLVTASFGSATLGLDLESFMAIVEAVDQQVHEELTGAEAARTDSG